MAEGQNKTQHNAAEIKKLWDCLQNVIALLDTATSLLTQAMDMPLAEPDNPAWIDFQNKPFIHEVIDVFGQVFDAKKIAQQTLKSMTANANAA